jgi:hypothetical protein
MPPKKKNAPAKWHLPSHRGFPAQLLKKLSRFFTPSKIRMVETLGNRKRCGRLLASVRVIHSTR